MNTTRKFAPPSTQLGLTLQLATAASSVDYADLPDRALTVARQCVLDWLGVTLAGAREPVTLRVLAEAAEDGGVPASTIYFHSHKVPAPYAAFVNGTASHALDFDDVNMAMPGHPTVAILPAVLALAEARKSSGRALIEAFIAGYETACRVGLALSPSHYNALGFHATATVGSLGAAAACSRLLGLDAERTATAMAIAATQANGLKSLFGTDCKPFHAGKAAENGLRAARLASRGFTARTDILECPQGMGAAMSTSFDAKRAGTENSTGYLIERNLFKYHAACYLTHATIDACRKIVGETGLTPDDVETVVLRLDESCGRVCNITAPRTGLEAKFSLRHTAAMALSGTDTAAIASYGDAEAQNAALVRQREKVRLEFVTGWDQTRTDVEILTRDGRRLSASTDLGVPASDLASQQRRLDEKFRSLVTPLVGLQRARELAAAATGIDAMPEIGEFAALVGDLNSR